MVQFFAIDKRKCGYKECSQSIGVWAYECCGSGKLDCCGGLTLAGWLTIGIVATLLVIIVLSVLCKK
ncbi:unnamed protein product [Cylicocyclus nassatus]|uniref:Uncharacterized protein n=1 Tax=Cylicocyclus nassatus TaxID=53992 RepID=A0AA36DLQ9_CYLNA|nr:unnamed protein product [Cylicocyclus nassatus]